MLATAILIIVGKRPGVSERELAQAIYGKRGYQQLVNSDCRLLASRGSITRRLRPDGVNGYWLG